MAREIADFNGTVVAPDGTYPYGRVKDAPNGTVADETMIGDTIQFTQKLMGEAGVTPNGNPDNNSAGWQIYEAFETLVGRGEWQQVPSSGAGSTIFTATGGGSVTVDAADRVYERYQLLGNTLRYQCKLLGVNISGTVDTIEVNLTFLGSLIGFKNDEFWIPNCLNKGVFNLWTVLRNTVPPHYVLYYKDDGTPFPTGASNEFYISFEAELEFF